MHFRNILSIPHKTANPIIDRAILASLPRPSRSLSSPKLSREDFRRMVAEMLD